MSHLRGLSQVELARDRTRRISWSDGNRLQYPARAFHVVQSRCVGRNSSLCFARDSVIRLYRVHFTSSPYLCIWSASPISASPSMDPALLQHIPLRVQTTTSMRFIIISHSVIFVSVPFYIFHSVPFSHDLFVCFHFRFSLFVFPSDCLSFALMLFRVPFSILHYFLFVFQSPSLFHQS